MENEQNAITEDLYRYDDEFRNSLGTVDEQGHRVWVYPKKPSGNLHRWRSLVAIVLLIFFFAGPFLKMNGHPLLLLNFFERKFIVLGQVFWPQDFFLLALTVIIFFVFIILFTVVFGRIWCGWACPQTLFLEMVFRKIEYWIEGDAQAQRRLDAGPWNVERIVKKVLKHFLFVIISILIAHIAMAYLIGKDETFSIIQQSPLDHLPGFMGLVAFTGIFYGVFARFREQACIAVCPYGRLQSVLLTKESIVVAYDWLRGEPRGKIRKQSQQSQEYGDCIDCKLCVHVCPTGIDIRNGTQLECVNCTACIDACDEVMLKVNRPKGLIRFASYNTIQHKIKKIINPRVVGYTVVLFALLGLWSFLIFSRSAIETTVLRARGTLYQRTEEGLITNLFHVEFTNKTFDKARLHLVIESPRSAVLQQVAPKPLVVPAEGSLKTIFLVKIPQKDLKSNEMEIHLGVYQHEKKIEDVEVHFMGPFKRKE